MKSITIFSAVCLLLVTGCGDGSDTSTDSSHVAVRAESSNIAQANKVNEIDESPDRLEVRIRIENNTCGFRFDDEGYGAAKKRDHGSIQQLISNRYPNMEIVRNTRVISRVHISYFVSLRKKGSTFSNSLEVKDVVIKDPNLDNNIFVSEVPVDVTQVVVWNDCSTNGYVLNDENWGAGKKPNHNSIEKLIASRYPGVVITEIERIFTNEADYNVRYIISMKANEMKAEKE